MVLDGGNSSDPDGDPLSYSWTIPAGVDAVDSGEARLRFTAPDVGQITVFTFTLTVSDGNLQSTDQVEVAVEPCSSGPNPDDFEPWNATSTYLSGDQVSHDNMVWRAQWWTRGEEPGSSQVWQQLGGSSEWDPGKAYQGGEETNYQGRRYRARWWTRGDDPATSSVWEDVGPAFRLLIFSLSAIAAAGLPCGRSFSIHYRRTTPNK